ncbi:hypothetical protein B1C81_18620 [Streptomyces sp. HG99]|nr:hypothetical protein B1C81_18620 [Streptomyces sp. HG99]
MGRPSVTEVHDLHVWAITSGQPALSAHVLAAPGADCHAVRQDLEKVLHTEYEVTHVTLQVDHSPAVAQSETGQRAHCLDPHGPVHLVGAHAH